jgi:hypothetical protein
MGALVLTKGTRHLVAHFQTEFNGQRLNDLRNDYIMGTTTLIRDAFANGNVDLLWLTNNIKHAHSPRADHKCLLPDDGSAGQAHLEARWIYFLTSAKINVLGSANHQIIRKAISTVLKDTSYGYIDFDCIDCPTQTVFPPADEFDNSGANPVKYLRIVLGTPAMDKLSGTNLSLDQQGGYTSAPPILVVGDGNGGGDGNDGNGD